MVSILLLLVLVSPPIGYTPSLLQWEENEDFIFRSDPLGEMPTHRSSSPKDSYCLWSYQTSEAPVKQKEEQLKLLTTKATSMVLPTMKRRENPWGLFTSDVMVMSLLHKPLLVHVFQRNTGGGKRSSVYSHGCSSWSGRTAWVLTPALLNVLSAEGAFRKSDLLWVLPRRLLYPGQQGLLNPGDKFPWTDRTLVGSLYVLSWKGLLPHCSAEN